MWPGGVSKAGRVPALSAALVLPRGAAVFPFALGPAPNPKGLFATRCDPPLALVETGPVSD